MTSFSSSKLMLAHSWNAEQYKAQDFLMSEKLDGMRALWDGKKLVSRNGNKIHAPKFFIDGFPAHMALDGELFAGRGQFKKTISIARRHEGGDLWKSLKFVVFDAPSVKAGFETRLVHAKTATIHLKFVDILPHVQCRDLDHLTQELQRVEELDGEGMMMRKKNSTYHHGRSKDLLKVKTFKDDEAIVYAHQKGKGKHAGRMGALMCRLRNGVEFKVGSGFSDSERSKPPEIDTIITYRYFEISNSSGKPRFPVFIRIRSDMTKAVFLGGAVSAVTAAPTAAPIASKKPAPKRKAASEEEEKDSKPAAKKRKHTLSSRGMWQYWVDDGVDGKGAGWHDYTKEASTQAEYLYKAYQNKNGNSSGNSSSPLLQIAGFTYLLDLQNMTQTNVSHHNQTTRRIQRCPVA